MSSNVGWLWRKKRFLTQHILLVLTPSQLWKQASPLMHGWRRFVQRDNLFWELLWNDNSPSCCRWSRSSFGQRGQSESNVGAARWFTGLVVPMPRCFLPRQKERGWRGAGSSKKGNSFPVKYMYVFTQRFEFGCLSDLNWGFFVCTSSPCVVFPWRTQVCVITAVIRPGYGPPASDWTLSSPAWLTTKDANTADSACDDAVRRLCLMGRYFYVGYNLLELFNNVENDGNYHTQQSSVMLQMKEL